MSAEPALIDTNVLVYALFAERPEHAASLALVESAQDPGANLVIAPQNLAEFYAVVSNPRRVSTPLSATDARVEVEKLTRLPGLRRRFSEPALSRFARPRTRQGSARRKH